MTKREQEQREFMWQRLAALGFNEGEFRSLRRISMTLSRWGERECGDGSDWAIERDEESWIECKLCQKKSYGQIDDLIKKTCGHCARDLSRGKAHIATNKPFLVYHGPGKSRRIPIADREKGALKRLATIMASHPDCVAYHQPDCRGAAVYVIPRDGLTGPVDSCYTNGVAVY